MTAEKLGSLIKEAREKQNMTQNELAEKLFVTAKAVSKWETGKGYPDITLWENLGALLHLSPAELFAGSKIENRNRGFNMLKVRWYICPVCGNILYASGEASVFCCGIPLMPCEDEPCDEFHGATLETVENEYLLSFDHEMTKEHYISFAAAVSGDKIHLVKLYPEGACEVRLPQSGVRKILFYCNRHGLFTVSLPKREHTPSPKIPFLQ